MAGDSHLMLPECPAPPLPSPTEDPDSSWWMYVRFYLPTFLCGVAVGYLVGRARRFTIHWHVNFFQTKVLMMCCMATCFVGLGMGVAIGAFALSMGKGFLRAMFNKRSGTSQSDGSGSATEASMSSRNGILPLTQETTEQPASEKSRCPICHEKLDLHDVEHARSVEIVKENGRLGFGFTVISVQDSDEARFVVTSIQRQQLPLHKNDIILEVNNKLVAGLSREDVVAEFNAADLVLMTVMYSHKLAETRDLSDDWTLTDSHSSDQDSECSLD
ncbi:uncharacterized protein LOC129597797 [Paramacrobiotus metropolitanus]|uniref:uncharacterized protein LOC129597797 n=1 Tax=Paramacrobiotus metropolitanus TaxID=2943436 RepID=UPI00244598F0|nr:uncharacterized protein LOC129597797 [Paramacrobiotus metropolitanus]XP_055351452.1 uncharacterized protein LOC129597797 [Paramacrobiotus metropolitanus]XP_055351453.1 uncharacterized protein LOC129597797 [Paramacrobiotus metropolitanus]